MNPSIQTQRRGKESVSINPESWVRRSDSPVGSCAWCDRGQKSQVRANGG
jgi:hypothetical protein